jgi:hypothetical protein
MMIGPAPMMSTEWMSVRLGIKAGETLSQRPAVASVFLQFHAARE